MIAGKTVVLTVVERADVQLIRRWRNSPAVYQMMANRDLITEAQQSQWYEGTVSAPSSCFMLVRMGTDRAPIGLVQLKDIDQRNRNAEAGVYIADEQYRSNLYGTEALYLLLDYGFGYLNLHKAYAHVLVENDAALRMNEAFGFRTEGTLRDEIYYDGTFHDYHRIGVIRDEFYASELAQRFKREQ